MSQRITGNSSKPMGVSGMSISQSGLGNNRGSMGYMMVVPDNGGSLDFLDDGFTSNRDGVRYRDRFGHMVRGGHFNDFFNMDGYVIRNIVWFLNRDSFIDCVDFFLNCDNGC